jgi:hypothetical protein
MSNPGQRASLRAPILAAVAALTTALVTLALAGVAYAATGPYVSLGDSYTAGALIPELTGQPSACWRSTLNYPRDLAKAIEPSSFTDVSCGGAQTNAMTQPQGLLLGQTNPPQFDALNANDALVTVGIGGNDANLIGVAEECIKLDIGWPWGETCKNHYTSSGTNTVLASIQATGPKVAAVLLGIHSRAPHARVVLVGYQDILPQNGTTCWPVVPLSSADVVWLNEMEIELNKVLAQTAPANGATYVDTFQSSIGHDACAGINHWINGLIPTSPAAPLHPNQWGEANTAKQIEAAL